VLSLVAVSALAGDYDHAVFQMARDAQLKGRETGRCLLHKRDMSPKKVPVVFGFNDTAKDDPVPADARVRFFPHAAEFSVNSHAGEKGTPKTAKVYVCPDCQNAEKKWKQEHPK
jgi:hypothetical protein